jgi:hypothetical protein
VSGFAVGFWEPLTRERQNAHPPVFFSLLINWWTPARPDVGRTPMQIRAGGHGKLHDEDPVAIEELAPVRGLSC